MYPIDLKHSAEKGETFVRPSLTGPSGRKWLNMALIAGGVGLGVYCLKEQGYLPSKEVILEFVKTYQDKYHALGLGADALFLLAQSAAGIIPFPFIETALNINGAVMYGKYSSIGMNLLGNTLGSLAGFYMARWFLKTHAERINRRIYAALDRYTPLNPERFKHDLEHSPISSVIFIKSVPGIYTITSYFLGLSQISVGQFMLGVWLSTTAPIAALSFITGQFVEDEMNHTNHFSTHNLELLVALGTVVLNFAMIRAIRWHKSRQLS